MTKESKQKDAAHGWQNCEHCGAHVRCGHCGNNCCNGGSGAECPDKCASAYAHQEAGWAQHDRFVRDSTLTEVREILEEYRITHDLVHSAVLTAISRHLANLLTKTAEPEPNAPWYCMTCTKWWQTVHKGVACTVLHSDGHCHCADRECEAP